MTMNGPAPTAADYAFAAAQDARDEARRGNSQHEALVRQVAVLATGCAALAEHLKGALEAVAELTTRVVDLTERVGALEASVAYDAEIASRE